MSDLFISEREYIFAPGQISYQIRFQLLAMQGTALAKDLASAGIGQYRDGWYGYYVVNVHFGSGMQYDWTDDFFRLATGNKDVSVISECDPVEGKELIWAWTYENAPHYIGVNDVLLDAESYIHNVLISLEGTPTLKYLIEYYEKCARYLKEIGGKKESSY